MDTYFKALKQILEEKDEITFLSGAGLSTSAGLPDFRSDENGFWKSNSPVHFRDFLSSKKYRMKSWQNNIAIHKKLENIKPTKMHNLVNKVMSELFEKPYPARAAYEVSKLPKNSSIEIETIALKN